MNIVFIGMPASGKSTIGRAFAKKYGYSFVDTDEVINNAIYPLSIKEYININGQSAFKELEEGVVLSLSLGDSKTVISTGGSVIYSGKAIDALREMGLIVFLNISYVEMKKRLAFEESQNLANGVGSNSRGIVFYPYDNLKDLYEYRFPLYCMAANYTFSYDTHAVKLAENPGIDKIILAIDDIYNNVCQDKRF